MNQVSAPGSVNLIANQIVCSPFVIGVKADGTPWTLNFDRAGAWVITPSPGNMDVAIYFDDPTSPGRPGKSVQVWTHLSTAVAGLVSAQVSNPTLTSGIYYWCVNADNSSAKVAAAAVDVQPGLIGSTSPANILTNTLAVGAMKTPMTYGMWPPLEGNATWTAVPGPYPMTGFWLNGSAQ